MDRFFRHADTNWALKRCTIPSWITRDPEIVFSGL
jgi:hypothetical protein